MPAFGDLSLPFPVVAKVSRFKHAGRADTFDGKIELCLTRDDRKGRMWIATIAKEVFFTLSVLANMQNFRAGMHRFLLRNPVYDFGGNVLKFEGHNVHRCDKLFEQGFLGESAVKFPIRYLPGGAVGGRLESMNSISHSSG